MKNEIELIIGKIELWHISRKCHLFDKLKFFFENKSHFRVLEQFLKMIFLEVPCVANVGAGAGTDVRRPGPLRVHHHADQPREEERGLREHVLELQQERQQR